MIDECVSLLASRTMKTALSCVFAASVAFALVVWKNLPRDVGLRLVSCEWSYDFNHATDPNRHAQGMVYLYNDSKDRLEGEITLRAQVDLSRLSVLAMQSIYRLDDQTLKDPVDDRDEIRKVAKAYFDARRRGEDFPSADIDLVTPASTEEPVVYAVPIKIELGPSEGRYYFVGFPIPPTLMKHPLTVSVDSPSN